MAALPESGSASTCRTPTQAPRHSSMPRAYPAAAMAMSRVIGSEGCNRGEWGLVADPREDEHPPFLAPVVQGSL